MATNQLLLFLTSNSSDSLDIRIQEAIYDDFYFWVYDMIYSIARDHASTEDIIQEAFVHLLDVKPRYIDENKASAWIKTVTKNVALNYMRKDKKFRDQLLFEGVKLDDLFQQPVHSTVEHQVDKKMKKESLSKILRQIKPHYRYVLELKYTQEYTYKEMAEILEESEGAIRQRLARAREAMKKVLNKHEEWGEANERQEKRRV